MEIRNRLMQKKNSVASIAVALAFVATSSVQIEPNFFIRVYSKTDQPPDKENAEAAEIRRRFGPDAQLLGHAVRPGAKQNSYFAELPDELAKRAARTTPRGGDVSAVIETPSMFLLYVARG